MNSKNIHQHLNTFFAAIMCSDAIYEEISHSKPERESSPILNMQAKQSAYS